MNIEIHRQLIIPPTGDTEPTVSVLLTVEIPVSVAIDASDNAEFSRSLGTEILKQINTQSTASTQ